MPDYACLLHNAYSRHTKEFLRLLLERGGNESFFILILDGMVHYPRTAIGAVAAGGSIYSPYYIDELLRDFYSLIRFKI